MMRRLRWTGLVVVAVMALGSAACGGGGPSTEDFTREANAICQEHRATIDAAASEVLAGGQLPDPEEFGRLAQETIIPELTAQLEELRKVEPAKDVADEYERVLSLGEQAVADIRQDPSVLTDPANFQEVNQQVDAAGLSPACRIGPG